MHKLLIILLLVITGVSIGADIYIKPGFDFGLISPTAYDLDLRYSNSLQRMYVIAEFAVDPQSLPEATYHSLFLCKNLHLEQIFVNGQLRNAVVTSDLVPQHFNPVFPVPALLDSTCSDVCYSFNFDKLKESNEPIAFKLVYWMDMPELKADFSGQPSTSITTDVMWFPRNLTGLSTLNVKVTTTNSYHVRLVNQLNYSDDNGIRTHEGIFTDEPNKYFELKIIKS